MRDLIKAELRQADRLQQKHLDGFIKDGVPALNLAKLWDGEYAFVGHDWVVFDGARFEFARHAKGGLAQSAFVFPVWNAYGDLADIAGWRPPHLALWLGRVSILGEEQTNGPRMCEPLKVHTTVLDWFKAEREGIFIVDYAHAAHVLRCETLGAADLAHARLLKAKLTLQAPPIVIVEDHASTSPMPQAAEVAA